VWERCFTVAPLVLIGTTDEDGALDFAPKHMVAPMGWQNFIGFVCTPTHRTYVNIERTGVFTVSYPKPSQLLFASLAASPRDAGGNKPILKNLSTFSASQIDGEFVDESYLYFECRCLKTVDGFGDNSLITGEIVAAYADSKAVRESDFDDQELIHDCPLFVYLAPGRFATISRSNAFPFPADMKR
jgi:flavin reductase (DIM6/NTAB) family NADH-FMN oxidoreductase RutF